MELTKAVEKLTGSFSFGNEILYDMCAKATLSNANHLADMIWLIGRSYAASPERRTYGYKKENGKIKTDERGKRIPLFKAQNANDGKGSFFINIATFITEQEEAFGELQESIKTLQGGYEYNGTDDDVKLLSTAIAAVALFNQLIRSASESFDGISAEAKNAGAACKNQISFCSKFLHFHCPKNVYIIDQYSLLGGKWLIPQKALSKKVYFEGESEPLEMKDFNLLKREYKVIYERMNAEIKNKKNGQNIFVGDEVSETDETMAVYAQHCARAYCISKYLTEKEIENVNPRFIDNLFLRIK